MQLAKRLIASVTLASFSMMACTQQAATTEEPTEITVETWRAGDYEPQYLDTETIATDAIAFARKIIIGDVESIVSIANIPETTFVLPLNNGESATVKRTAVGFELVSFTGPAKNAAGADRGTITAVELRGDNTLALRYKDSPASEADVLVKLTDVPGDNLQAVQAALALQSLVMSLEDTEQWVQYALLLLVASVTAFWLWSCYDHNKSCASRCERWGYSGYAAGCGNRHVSFKNYSFSIGWTDSFYCYCQ